jgi:hypothetical protein
MFFKKSLITICLLFVVCLKPFAQVSLQTGSAVFSLPIFNWQDDKSRLNSVIALNYSSGNGLKVNDIPSNEGQGWNLIAGGVITRMQVGEPDDQIAYNGTSNFGNGSDQDVTKYPAGYLYHTIGADLGCPNTLTKYPIYGGQNVLYSQKQLTAEDKQQDYFAFQFNGKSGMFILDTTGGDHGIPLGDTKLKIAFQCDPSLINSGIRTTITSFTITDVDGLIYKFTYHGLTKLLKSIFSNEDGTKIRTQPTIHNNGVYCQGSFDLGPTSAPWANQYMANPYIIGSWYLSEVDDPFTSRKITFSYHSLSLSLSAGQDISYNNSLNKYVVISYKKSVTNTLELDSINYQDGHVAIFSYAAAPRFDYPGEHALSTISILYNDNGKRRYLSQYQLGTSYFILRRCGNPVSEGEKKVARLCLKSIKKIGVDLKEDSPPYTFNYYTGSDAPDDFVPPLFCYAKDIWGYYNGSNSKASNGAAIPLDAIGPYPLGFSALKGLCFQIDNVTGTNYNAKSGYAQNGLLKEIIYPTGGSLTYQYIQNSGSFINDATVRTVGGVHVSQTSSSDGGYSNGCDNPIITHYDDVMNGSGSASSLWGLETPLNSITSNNYWQEERSTVHFSWSHPLGTCLWHYVYPGILSEYQSVSLDGFQKIMAAIAPVLGILSVISTINDVANVIASTGVGAVVAVIIDVITTVIGYFVDCSKKSKYTPNTIYYDFDLNQMAPLPAQFKRVEVTESSGTNGKTVQLFTHGDPTASGDPQYYPLWFPGQNLALSSKQRFAPWAYGLPYLTTVYDLNGNKIKETQNKYDFNYAKREVLDPVNGILCSDGGPAPKEVTSCKCQVVNNSSERNDWWTSATPAYVTQSNADMNVDIYNFYSGRALLFSTLERTYRITDPTQFVQTETDYNYNSADCDILTNYSSQSNYEVNSISTIQSNGDANTKYIKYTTDFNSGIFSTMIQKNIVSTPVVTSTKVFKYLGSAPQYLNEKVTEFTQLSGGNIKPSRIIEQRFATPQSSFTPYSGPLTTNYASYKIPQVFSYDANSNLIAVKDEGNRIVSNIYDYNDKYLVASVINADPVLDLPAYTSFETSVLGGWILTGPPTYSTTNFITGARSFILNGCTLSANISTAKPYLLSFWANNGSVAVTGGATLSRTGPTYLGMTYYEYNIPQGTSSVALTGNSNIDELRIYPTTARMRTTTYDPLIGKTSECDENNRITYYTYDNLARLQFIKDEAGNVVKAYEYNNVSAAKQNGCPASYSNHFISESFTRSNCDTGYQGGTVTYTVAAGIYTSTISQFDADLKAELYLLTNAQNYANANGSCSLIYHNSVQSKTDTTQNCDAGKTGGVVTYTVPANTYTSIISQADADQQALDDITANAQAYANTVVNMACSVDTAADWEWFSGDSTTPADPSYCLSVNGQLPPHQFVLATDVNPNSPTFNQTTYYDYGPTASCPANTYFNVQQSQSFTRNNCGTGYIGGTVTYTVPPGAYGSTISQAAADQLATNDMNANGQNYANANGQCISAGTISYTRDVSESVTAKYTNNATGTVYNLHLLSSGTFSIPAGTYTVTITVFGSASYFISLGCTSNAGFSPITFYNVNVSSSSCNSLSVSYDY